MSACGRFEIKKSPKVNPSEQKLQVGDESIYVLDPKASDDVISASKLAVKVTAVDKVKTTFSLRGKAETDFGTQNISIDRSVSNSVLQKSFVEKLRTTRRYKDREFQIDYLGKVANCDLLRISNIKDYDWIKVNANFCEETKNVPKILAEFKFFGQNVKATYLLQN